MADVPVTTIDATGVHLPTYDELIAYFQSSFRNIYGQDIDFDNSIQDAQWLALIALACQTMNSSTAAVYNAFSPGTAQGAGLSSVVKINGLARKIATYSTVDQRIVGEAGTQIYSGVVSDTAGTRWNLPAFVEIPFSGEITVTATAADIGAVTAPINTITSIVTPTRGFQSTNNTAAAAPGQPVETDAELRQRQLISTSLPAMTILESVVGALLAVPGVVRVRGYENDGNVPDSNGIPAHAIAFVVQGGDANTISQVIASKKSVGVGTYGDVLTTLPDRYGISHPIRFFRFVPEPVAWNISLRAKRGYTADVATAIKTAIVDYTNTLGIGEDLCLRRAYVPANLPEDPRKSTYEIVDLVVQRRDTTSDTYGDLISKFNAGFTSNISDVKIQVVP